ncbi:phage head-tail connector protein [uncultured Eubacterium sp.]|uniref:phage head-tail connector protein n=1 Tax=uncultured Eubacterium sp. TaxID=165185 RepID=UPI002639BF06|nr:phage head-tail connector protein [uncultured Eubacterium sp.]
MDNLERLKLRIPEACNDELLIDILDTAKNLIQLKRFPFADEFPIELESKYAELQLQIAVRIYNKFGAEGEQIHIESGVTRNYGTTEEYADLLARVIPKAGVK